MMHTVNNKDELNRGIYGFLGRPLIYSFFGRIVGTHDKYKMYTDKFIKPLQNPKILDIGCGTADILNFLPLNVNYTGYDVNPSYIFYARKKFGHRATFHNARVNTMTEAKLQNHFDVVLADGLLHHLNDAEAAQLFDIGYHALKKNGFLLTFDPAYIKSQQPFAKMMCNIDRGQHVRFPEQYKRIAQISFNQVDIMIRSRGKYLKRNGCILKCSKI